MATAVVPVVRLIEDGEKTKETISSQSEGSQKPLIELPAMLVRAEASTQEDDSSSQEEEQELGRNSAMSDFIKSVMPRGNEETARKLES